LQIYCYESETSKTDILIVTKLPSSDNPLNGLKIRVSLYVEKNAQGRQHFINHATTRMGYIFETLINANNALASTQAKHANQLL
jgi:hypothetical protein